MHTSGARSCGECTVAMRAHRTPHHWHLTINENGLTISENNGKGRKYRVVNDYCRSER
jgi:hypothetical protein